ncbi:hypothetical protein ACQY0O_007824 [Thecaphora frezii]
MLAAVPAPAPLPLHQAAPTSGASLSFRTGQAAFQRRLYIPLDSRPSIDAPFPGILEPTTDLPPSSDSVEAFLSAASSLARQPSRDSAPAAASGYKDASLLRHHLDVHGGAIVFRRTPLRSADDFSRFLHVLAEGAGWEAHVDKGLMVLRRPYAANVATANEGPPTQPIGSHNEYGLSTHFPQYISFFCLSKPDQGGQTPIASSLKLYHELQREVPEYTEALQKKGVAFSIHHPRDKIEGSLQGNALFSASAFGPKEGEGAVQNLSEEERRRIVDANVAALAAEGGWTPTLHRDQPDAPNWQKRGFGTTWLPDDSVLVTQRVPGIRKHPQFDANTYFNNINNRFAYSRQEGAQDPPHVSKTQTTKLGTPFYQVPPYLVEEEEDVQMEKEWIEVGDRLTKEAQVDVEWEVGDVLLLDNLAVQHARRTWKGDRRLLASLWDVRK